jgi:zinc protease
MSFPSPLARFRLLRTLASVACLLIPALAGATLPIQSWQLPNGARVLFVENRALPMLDVSVDFPAGASRDVTETAGLAAMTVGLMRLGAGGLGESEISSRLADVGAIMGTRFDADRAGYQARTLSSPQERSQTLDLLAKVLQAPAFPADVLDRERSRLTASLKEAALKPESIAERAFQTAVFRDHPRIRHRRPTSSSARRRSRAAIPTSFRCSSATTCSAAAASCRGSPRRSARSAACPTASTAYFSPMAQPGRS